MSFGGKPLSRVDAEKAFNACDADGSGYIDRQELLNVVRAVAKNLDMDEDECKASTGDIITKSNNVGTADNKISKEEFFTLIGL